ncbi:hypothetical protein A2U01_0104516, partial [Trifolium medium]|nr:hypothetical protein [Trifolium medium]
VQYHHHNHTHSPQMQHCELKQKYYHCVVASVVANHAS